MNSAVDIGVGARSLSRGIWVVPTDPAKLDAMADHFGQIYEDRQAGRKTRWRIYICKRNGRPVYLTGTPNPVDPANPARFASRAEANVTLKMIRRARASGFSIDEIASSIIPAEVTKELVETWAAKYLTAWRSRVRTGDSSPTSLREIERWAKAGGHWGWWWSRDIRTLTNGDVSEWHEWLASRVSNEKTGEVIHPKTRKNVSDGFRAMLRWASSSSAQGAGEAWPIPVFPTISYAKASTPTLPVERVKAILERIPWERRGIYLAVAYESVRFGTACAALLEDRDPKDCSILWHRGRQGQRIDSPIGSQKNHEVTRRIPWAPELVKWLEWRIDQATDAERLAGKAQSLFFDPRAHNDARAWNYSSYRRIWAKACTDAGEKIAPQAGTRHSILSRLAEVLTPHELQNQSQHRSLQSLSHYTTGARANHAAMVRAIGKKDGGSE